MTYLVLSGHPTWQRKLADLIAEESVLATCSEDGWWISKSDCMILRVPLFPGPSKRPRRFGLCKRWVSTEDLPSDPLMDPLMANQGFCSGFWDPIGPAKDDIATASKGLCCWALLCKRWWKMGRIIARDLGNTLWLHQHFGNGSWWCGWEYKKCPEGYGMESGSILMNSTWYITALALPLWIHRVVPLKAGVRRYITAYYSYFSAAESEWPCDGIVYAMKISRACRRHIPFLATDLYQFWVWLPLPVLPMSKTYHLTEMSMSPQKTLPPHLNFTTTCRMLQQNYLKLRKLDLNQGIPIFPTCPQPQGRILFGHSSLIVGVSSCGVDGERAGILTLWTPKLMELS